MEFNKRLGSSISQSLGERFQKEKIEAEQTLLQMLQLRSVLEGAVTLSDEDKVHQVEGWDMQIKYVSLHVELGELRKRSAALSSEKVNH